MESPAEVACQQWIRTGVCPTCKSAESARFDELRKTVRRLLSHRILCSTMDPTVWAGRQVERVEAAEACGITNYTATEYEWEAQCTASS